MMSNRLSVVVLGMVFTCLGARAQEAAPQQHPKRGMMQEKKAGGEAGMMAKMEARRKESKELVDQIVAELRTIGAEPDIAVLKQKLAGVTASATRLQTLMNQESADRKGMMQNMADKMNKKESVPETPKAADAPQLEPPTGHEGHH